MAATETSQQANGELPHHPSDVTIEAELKTLHDAIRSGRVTFHPVAHAWFRLSDHSLSEDHRKAFAAVFPQLLESFSEPRGGIITSYLCQHIPVAAVLTDIDRAASLTDGLPVYKQSHDDDRDEDKEPDRKLSARERARQARERRAQHRREMAAASSSAIHLEPLRGQPADWKAKELLFRCMDLHYRALQYLTPKPRKICMRMIFGIVVALLGVLDVPQSERRQRPFSSNLTAVESLEAELEQARRYYDRSAQRQAQFEYFVGMVAGLILLVVGLIVIGLIARAPLLNEPLLATPLAGGAGAVVSVMMRMTRDQLTLNYESGLPTIRLLGVIRPLLGALFGGAIYLLLAGELISITGAPKDATKLLYFYTGIAFLAGFSERWAQDVVTGKSGGSGAVSAAAAVPPASRPNPTPRVPGAN